MKEIINRIAEIISDNEIEAEFQLYQIRELLEKETNKDSFKITSICREDLQSKGFDTSNVDDATMEKLASKLSDDYVEYYFWDSMKILADLLGIPRDENFIDPEEAEYENEEGE